MRQCRTIPVILAVLMVVCTSVSALGGANDDAEQLARWQLNNADLLVDEGKYLEAVEYVDSSYEISRYPKTRRDALLSKAMILAIFLDAPMQAVEVYRQLAREFPETAETAAYQAAFLAMQAGRTDEARQGFRDYLKRYPEGRFRYQAEAMLETLGEPSARPEPVAPAAERPVLRVLLATKCGKVALSGRGADICVDGVGCGPTATLQAANGGVLVNGRAGGLQRLDVRSDKPMALDMDGKKKVVRGDLRITVVGNRLSVTNLVDIEAYLRSVVPAESYASWPLETLKAQAVAARTYAYYQKLHRTSREYDVRADTFDQMYGGVGRETGRTDQAVRETAGKVLTYGGKPILAQYTANSGGYCADAGAVFSAAKPYLVAHSDPASLKGKMATWTRKFTTAEIVASLKKIGVDAPGLKSIEPEVSGPSGRIIKVRLTHAGGSTVLRTRTTLASSRVLGLPEVLMGVDKRGDTYFFNGRGHGHGVGYSQWGAAELGKEWRYAKILGFYYPGTSIEDTWR
ncbi:MAG: SpoIID/LytB domain-containing protein [Pseudodesulfovibrio sp.]|jgi:stage II sporulation protein D|uniref:SpoIID/LytB domain-containing protein n=1 Tax=Pseudodesulfovibrio sp. TaxID=2035812 RepID=UPI003D0C4FB0